MNIDLFLHVLPYILKGLVGIFLVTFIIVLCIFLLNKLTAKRSKDTEQQ